MGFCQRCQHTKSSDFHHCACPILASAEDDDVLLLTNDELNAALEHGGLQALIGSRVGSVGLSRSKARYMLHEGVVRGHPITDRQRRFFAWVAGGGKTRIGVALIEEHVTFNEKDLAMANQHFRQVLNTTQQQQIVLMAITLEDAGIPEEVHRNTTQVFRVYAGSGLLYVNGVEFTLRDGVTAVVPPGARHKVIHTGTEPLRLSSTYSPPEHASTLIEARRTDLLERVQVVRVLDGDTVVDSSDQHYRLYGIDAPELKQPFGNKAKLRLQELLSEEVFVQNHGVDKYGRILATLYSVAKPNKEWQNYNYVLVAQGYAWAYRFVKEEKRRGEPIVPALLKYDTAQEVAQTQKLGLWKNEQAERPQDYRRRK